MPVGLNLEIGVFIMAVFKKCIGIVSYLPEEGNNRARTRRSERLTNLLLQITDLWPTIDIMIITQNWKNFTLPELSNKVIRFGQLLERVRQKSFPKKVFVI
jgi:hypothetical protein